MSSRFHRCVLRASLKNIFGAACISWRHVVGEPHALLGCFLFYSSANVLRENFNVGSKFLSDPNKMGQSLSAVVLVIDILKGAEKNSYDRRSGRSENARSEQGDLISQDSVGVDSGAVSYFSGEFKQGYVLWWGSYMHSIHWQSRMSWRVMTRSTCINLDFIPFHPIYQLFERVSLGARHENNCLLYSKGCKELEKVQKIFWRFNLVSSMLYIVYHVAIFSARTFGTMSTVALLHWVSILLNILIDAALHEFLLGIPFMDLWKYFVRLSKQIWQLRRRRCLAIRRTKTTRKLVTTSLFAE